MTISLHKFDENGAIDAEIFSISADLEVIQNAKIDKHHVTVFNINKEVIQSLQMLP